jgi:hypothetical protein
VMASRWRLTGATISARLLSAGAYGEGSPWGPLSRRHNVAQVWACLSGFVSRVCESDVTLIASSTTTMIARTRLIVELYVHCLS